MGQDCFPQTTRVVDLYHTFEHLGEVVGTLVGKNDPAELEKRRAHWKKMLLADGVDQIIDAARKEAHQNGVIAEFESAWSHFLNSRERMIYGAFQAKSSLIGSGLIKTGCRTVIIQRCKQSGMFWSKVGASILALRSINASARLQELAPAAAHDGVDRRVAPLDICMFHILVSLDGVSPESIRRTSC